MIMPTDAVIPDDLVDAEADAALAWLDADMDDEALAAARRAAVHVEELPAPGAGDEDAREAAARRNRVHALLGEAAWRRRAWEEVTRAYASLVDEPSTAARDRAVFAHRYGVALDKRGDLEGAAQAFEKTVAENAAAGDIRTNTWRILAGVYQRLGDPERAARLAERLERWRADLRRGGTGRLPELDPETESALRVLGYVE